MTERDSLAAARRGDEAAFAALVDPYRRELHAHCYRMLGSVPDAEDALQDALLGAWRGLAGFEGRSSLRSWLYTVTTNACLRAIRRRPRRVLPIDYGPPADPHLQTGPPAIETAWLEPFPDERFGLPDEAASPEARYEQRESVELAFVVALQHLPARQRAVLILREVLGFSARETAEMLETTPVSVDSALQRAHRTVDARLPQRSQQATLRSLDDARLREIVDSFMRAWERADVTALTAILSDDAVFSMPPQSEWFTGRDAVTTFLAAFPLNGATGWHLVPTRANGQLAFAQYTWDDDASEFIAHAIAVLTLRGREVEEIVVFRTPEVFPRFGLAERLTPRAS